MVHNRRTRVRRRKRCNRTIKKGGRKWKVTTMKSFDLTNKNKQKEFKDLYDLPENNDYNVVVFLEKNANNTGWQHEEIHIQQGINNVMPEKKYTYAVAMSIEPLPDV